MGVRSAARVICRARKVRVVIMTQTQLEFLKRLGIALKDYCRQPEIRKRMVVRYKFGVKQ